MTFDSLPGINRSVIGEPVFQPIEELLGGGQITRGLAQQFSQRFVVLDEAFFDQPIGELLDDRPAAFIVSFPAITLWGMK